MRLLVCQPGASWATSDVHDGLVRGFESLGHEIVRYQLDSRIAMSGAWLSYLHRQHKRRGGPLANVRPTPADVQYHAGIGLLERALRFEPSWVVVISAMFLHPDVLIMLNRAGKRVALVLTESPYDVEREALVAPWAQIVWTNERTSVPVLRQVNPNTHYLPAAYDPVRLAPTPELHKALSKATAHDVVFVGTGFQERVDLLEQIDWTGIDLGLYGEWSLLKRNSPLKPYLRGGLTEPEDTIALYLKAKIGLNLYRTSKGFGPKAQHIEGAESLNPRAYELAAAGVFQISSYRQEVIEVFAPHVPTFDGAAMCERLIRRYLAREDDRTYHAQAAQQGMDALTYFKRAEQVCRHLESFEFASRDAALSSTALPVVREARESTSCAKVTQHS